MVAYFIFVVVYVLVQFVALFLKLLYVQLWTEKYKDWILKAKQEQFIVLTIKIVYLNFVWSNAGQKVTNGWVGLKPLSVLVSTPCFGGM